MKKEITDFLLEKLKDHCSKAALGDVSTKDNLIEKGVLDSMAFLEFVTAIELNFDISVDFGDTDPNEFLTIDGLAKYVATSKSMEPPKSG